MEGEVEGENFVVFEDEEEQQNEQCFFCGNSCPGNKLIGNPTFPVDPLELDDVIDNGYDENEKKMGHEGEGGVQERKDKLRKLCGYLEITSDFLDNHFNENGGKSLLLFCEDCDGIVNKLSDLFDQLEMTGLWIKHFLKEICGKISKDSAVGRPLERHVAELRKLFKDKCLSKLLRDPQLILNNILETTSLASVSPPGSPPSPPVVGDEYLDTADCIILNDDNDDKNPKSTPTPTSPQNPCSFCPLLISPINQRNHLTTHHPEQLLLPHKLDQIPLPRFQQICYQLSRQKRDKSQIKTKTQSSKFPHGCIYCPMEYSQVNALRCHLFDSHMDMLEDEVIRIQNVLVAASMSISTSTTTTNQLQISEEDEDEDHRYDQQIILPSTSQQQEEIATPIPTPSPPIGTGPPSPKRKKRMVKPVNCKICHQKLSSSSSLSRHMRTVHKDALLPFLEIVPPEVPPSSPSPPFEISIPSTITMEVCEDGEQVGNLGVYEDFEKEDHFGWASQLEGDQNQVPFQVLRGHQCPYCERVLTDSSRLRLHISNVHTEQLLLKYKEDHVDVEEFQIICNNFLREHRKNLGEPVGSIGSRKRCNVACLHCDKIYSNGQYLKFHIIEEHEEVVARGLSELQKNI